MKYLRRVQLPTRLIEAAVDQIATFPGIGRRTALRLVLNMLARDEERVRDFAEAMVAMKEGVKPCSVCHNPTEDDTCNLCANPHRDARRFVDGGRRLARVGKHGREPWPVPCAGQGHQSHGRLGPADLNVDSLVSRAQTEEVNEVILALPASMEGDTTAFYLAKRLKETSTLLTALARGVAVGEALQYADEATLSSSLLNRLPYQG